MKKALILAVALTLVLSGIALASVVGSKHDMSTDANVTYTGTQVCVFCHHPHRGAVAAGIDSQNALLWNLTYDTAAESYDTYASSGTTTADVDATPTSAPQSLLCMSCHDTSLSANSFLNTDFGDGLTVSGFPDTANADIGDTFGDDHPIGFQYPTASAANVGDLETTLVTVAGVDYVLGTTGPGADGSYPLFGSTNTMECSTCHDVHKGDNSVDTSANQIQFMRGDVDQSSICIDCHTSK